MKWAHEVVFETRDNDGLINDQYDHFAALGFVIRKSGAHYLYPEEIGVQVAYLYPDEIGRASWGYKY